MPQNKYHWYNWDEYLRRHNVLNCNAVHQQSGPCGKAKDKRDAKNCMNECKEVLKTRETREAKKERWRERILRHNNNNAPYGRWQPRERKHLDAFMCRDQLECRNNAYSEDCRMCKEVMKDTQNEYNKRIRATNKLRFGETNRFGRQERQGRSEN